MIIRLCFYDKDFCKTKQVKLDSPDELKRWWSALVHNYGGQRYDAWAGERECKDVMCAGVFREDVLSEILAEHNTWEEYYRQRRVRYAH